MVMGRGANTDNASFGLQKLLQRKDPKLFLKFKFKMTKEKLYRPYLACWQACTLPKRPSLNTLDTNVLIKYTLFEL